MQDAAKTTTKKQKKNKTRQQIQKNQEDALVQNKSQSLRNRRVTKKTGEMMTPVKQMHDGNRVVVKSAGGKTGAGQGNAENEIKMQEREKNI